jgi:hypothetical protein
MASRDKEVKRQRVNLSAAQKSELTDKLEGCTCVRDL